MRNSPVQMILLGLLMLAGCDGNQAARRRPSSEALSPLEKVAQEQTNFNDGQAALKTALRNASTPSDRLAAVAAGPDRRAVFQRFMTLEREFPGTEAGLFALVLAHRTLRTFIQIDTSGKTISDEEYAERRVDFRQMAEVFQTLAVYAKHPAVGKYCGLLASDSPGLETFLREVIATNPDRSCQGQALLALSNKLIGDAILSHLCQTNPDRVRDAELRFGKDEAANFLAMNSKALLQEALSINEKIQRQYSDISVASSKASPPESLAAAAEANSRRVKLISER